jgi:hypothetical protein
MSTRLAFFDLQGLEEVGIERLGDALSSNRFTDDSTTGFLIDRRNNSALESRFIEKVVVSDSFTDPLGNSYTQKRVLFNELRFLLRKDRPQLVVFNTNSAFKAFTGRLLELSDFRLSITPLALRPVQVVEHFETEFEAMIVYAAYPHPINYSPSVIIRLGFEGTEDVRKHVRSFTKARNITYTTLRFQFSTPAGKMKCEIKETGTLVLYGECDPLIVEKAMTVIDKICAKCVKKA